MNNPEKKQEQQINQRSDKSGDSRVNNANGQSGGSGQPRFPQYQSPQVTLPKGGGAIRGMGEKFTANPVTGTGSMAIPLPFTPGRSGFNPQLTLAYNSGSGNSPYGLGWDITIPSVTRKTSKGVPQYDDYNESDVFLLTDAEDLVPVLTQDSNKPDIRTSKIYGSIYTVHKYRPRTEGLFARIERWVNTATKDTHWRTITRDNITSLYGYDSGSRIADSENPHRVYSWLLCRTFDDRGNVIVYQYKDENSNNINLKDLCERNRTENSRSVNRYIWSIQYGNDFLWFPQYNNNTEPDLPSTWYFESVFDYGEHRDDTIPSRPVISEPSDDWELRPDPYSRYNAGFEIRTYRRCKRFLMYHHFPNVTEVGSDCLVRSLDLTFTPVTQSPSDIAGGLPSFSQIEQITQCGYIRESDGTYTSSALPTVNFEYTRPVIGTEVKTIDPQMLEDMTFSKEDSTIQWVDLYGEGLTGILAQYPDSWYYKRNVSPRESTGASQGDAAFEYAEPVREIPSLSAQSPVRFMDLAGDGHPDMVIIEKTVSGFHEFQNDLRLSNFREFSSIPNVNWNDPDLRFIDLTGDGIADILVTNSHVFTWYGSLKEEGFESANVCAAAVDEEKGPKVLFSDPEQTIYLADFSGDGLVDIVRIRNGEICYWPNLGYGRFGSKVSMAKAPLFDSPEQFNQSRIVLADIDGSGLTDILYYDGNGVTVYFNLSGNEWSPGHAVHGPAGLTDLSTVTAFDLLGNGTASLVWHSPLPSPDSKAVRYIELMSEGKPHLMSCIENNMGAVTELHYEPSTRFYLKDKQAGTPWLTRLSFPVHVLTQVKHTDLVSETSLTTRYAYHHGYFDGDEREFRGFARVEQWDAESFNIEIDSETSHEKVLNNPPAKTVSWFHTGAYWEQELFETALRKEYFDDGSNYIVPDTVFPSGLSGDEYREAARALKGSLLRTEIYAEDGNADKQDKPYQVTEQSFTIKCLQNKHENKYAVFFVHPDQAINLYYERDDTDPRISHNCTLNVDKYGNVLESASIAYPRTGVTGDPEQQKEYILYKKDTYFNLDSEEHCYRAGIPTEQTSWDLTGVTLPSNAPVLPGDISDDFTKDDIKIINYETLPDGTLQKRCVEFVQHDYYSNDLSGPLDHGTVESLALPYRSYVCALTDSLIQSVYGSRVDNTLLVNEGKYVVRDTNRVDNTLLVNEGKYVVRDTNRVDSTLLVTEGKYIVRDSIYWTGSSRLEFDSSAFYVPVKSIDPFDNETQFSYDSFSLQVVSITDPLSNVVQATYSYRIMAPVLITDPNGNRNQVTFDHLGRVTRLAVMGKDGSGDGDTIDDPTSAFTYITDAWSSNNKHKPNYVMIRMRENHRDSGTRWQESYTYTDGFGREAVTKVQAESGDAPIRDSGGKLQKNPDGTLVIQHIDNRWVGTGRTIYNNKGKPVKQYEPYFSSTHEYEDEDELVLWGVTPIMHYDPLGRLIRTDFPDGTFSKVEFDVWKQVFYDQNDTVADSQWYADRQEPGTSTEDARAATLVFAHNNSPSISHFDTLGRVYRVEENNSDGLTYETRTHYDIEGNVLSVKDQRDITVFTNKYDIAGAKIYTENPDNGVRRSLADVAGKQIRLWDSRNHSVRLTYDELQRPTHIYVDDDSGTEKCTSRTVYGELVTNPENTNHRGKVYQVFDDSGVSTTISYDFKGNVLETSKRITSDYTVTADWTAIANVSTIADIQSGAEPFLETGTFSSSSTYDALNRIVTQTSPDGSIVRPAYNEANLLERVEVDHRGSGTFSTIVRNIDYNARGQGEKIEYSNGTYTTYTYDPLTFRLKRLRTRRTSDSLNLQNYVYFYDPVGNIVEFQDESDYSHIFTNSPVSGHGLYEYDPLYRVTQATGREHPGQQPNSVDPARGSVPHHNDMQALLRYTENYSYDQTGNITSIRHTATGNNWNRQYHYDSLGNKLLATSAPGDPTGTFSNSYTYNAHGSMVSMPHINELSWNYAEQLKSTDLGGGGTVYYCYDSTGQRSRKVYMHSGVIEDRIYLGGFEIYRKKRNTTLELERETLHINDDTKRIALFETKTVDNDNPVGLPQIRQRWQLDNHLGSSSLELSDSAQVISYEEYHPFGSTAFHTVDSSTEVSAKRYRYTGKERDDETGLYYYGARYYAAWLGRWTGCDPSGAADGLDLYVYCRNSPFVLTDPVGRRIAFPNYSESSAKEMAKEGYYWKDDMWVRGNTPIEKSQSKTHVKSSDINNVKIKEPEPDVITSATEETNAHSGGGGGYLSKSFKSALLGDFSDEQTALSIGINIAIGFTPLGIVADIRDFAGSASKGDAVGMVFAGIGFLPVLGDIAKNLRKVEKVAEGVTSAGKLAGVSAAKGVTKGWKVGQPITNLTKAGKTPAWSTVRQRFWKNESLLNSKTYSPSNLARMQKGLAPQRINPRSGLLESMELHHMPPMRQGGLFEFQKVWPDEHAIIDPFRHSEIR